MITANEGEGFDSLLKRFNRKVQQDGVLSEARRREHYQKPVTRRARKAMARRRQASKAARADRKQ
ncbi:MAG: 30S ribosomal protein S21 [Dehalococcoidales bacterium]|nr:30S ribosomal protein S21 [Dehalococcoidales bacterium]